MPLLSLSPSVPLAHYDTFRLQLGIAHPAFGHALWETSSGEYPPVQVGDVGFTRQGQFHRLLNVLYSENHPCNQRFGVPVDHERLPPVPNDIARGTLYRARLCSYGVTATSGGSNIQAEEPPIPGSEDVSFSCTKKHGAVLYLPVEARHEDTLAKALFAEWIIRHIDSWFAFSQLLYMGIEMEDIVLVTGYHRTRSSSNVVFHESQVNARVSFGVQVPDGTTVNWQVSSTCTGGTMLNHGPSGENLPENQSIFIRGFRVKRTLFSKKIRAAAEPKPDSSENDEEPETEVVSIPSATDYRDPLHVLLDYIAERAPDCDMALVHDDDLERILEVGSSDGTSLEDLQPDVVMDYLERSRPKIELMSQEALADSDATPRTDTESMRVAMLSEQKRLGPLSSVPLSSHSSISVTNRVDSVQVDSPGYPPGPAPLATFLELDVHGLDDLTRCTSSQPERLTHTRPGDEKQAISLSPSPRSTIEPTDPLGRDANASPLRTASPQQGGHDAPPRSYSDIRPITSRSSLPCPISQALHLASSTGSVETVRELIDCGRVHERNQPLPVASSTVSSMQPPVLIPSSNSLYNRSHPARSRSRHNDAGVESHRSTLRPPPKPYAVSSQNLVPPSPRGSRTPSEPRNGSPARSNIRAHSPFLSSDRSGPHSPDLILPQQQPRPGSASPERSHTVCDDRAFNGSSGTSPHGRPGSDPATERERSEIPPDTPRLDERTPGKRRIGESKKELESSMSNREPSWVLIGQEGSRLPRVGRETKASPHYQTSNSTLSRTPGTIPRQQPPLPPGGDREQRSSRRQAVPPGWAVVQWKPANGDSSSPSPRYNSTLSRTPGIIPRQQPTPSPPPPGGDREQRSSGRQAIPPGWAVQWKPAGGDSSSPNPPYNLKMAKSMGNLRDKGTPSLFTSTKNRLAVPVPPLPVILSSGNAALARDGTLTSETLTEDVTAASLEREVSLPVLVDLSKAQAEPSRPRVSPTNARPIRLLQRPVDSSVFSEPLQKSVPSRSPLPPLNTPRFPRQLPPPVSREDSGPQPTTRILPIPGGTPARDDRSPDIWLSSLTDGNPAPAGRTPPRSLISSRNPLVDSWERISSRHDLSTTGSVKTPVADVPWVHSQSRGLINFNKSAEQTIMRDDNTLKAIHWRHLLDAQSSQSGSDDSEATMVEPEAFALPPIPPPPPPPLQAQTLRQIGYVPPPVPLPVSHTPQNVYSPHTPLSHDSQPSDQDGSDSEAETLWQEPMIEDDSPPDRLKPTRRGPPVTVKIDEESRGQASQLKSSRSSGGGLTFKWVRGELIGKSNFGRVYMALNATTGEMIAVKQVEIPRTASDENDSRQVTVVEALKLESETLKDLDHPNIVQYLGFEETPNFVNLFLEYVPGGSVGSYLRKYGRFEHNVTKYFTEQILSGLEYLHSKGILHRDLQADNILVEETGVCKISEFGISKRTDLNEQNVLTPMQGTVFWMAPEVVNPGKCGYKAKVDIWGVGCVVLEMWTGERPWRKEEAMAVIVKLYSSKQAPPIPSDIILDDAADDFTRKCFAINPDERPSAADLRKHHFLQRPQGWAFSGLSGSAKEENSDEY